MKRINRACLFDERPEARKTAPQKILNNLFMMIAPWVLH